LQQYVLDQARALMDISWIYLIVIAVAAIDSFLPLVPSEALMITCGVFAATQGRPSLLLLIPAGAVGAFVGDNISYFIGRWATGPVERWFNAGEKRKRSLHWAHHNIEKRGGLILIVARYIPGGRTATTLVMGVVRWSHPRFMMFDALAAVSWSAYGSLIGYLGGHAFEDNPIKGLLLGFGIAAAITVVVEIVRRVRSKEKRPVTEGT
jgi:membrane-associated protein